MLKVRGKLYIEIPDIADVLGWSYLRTYRWLRRENVLVRRASRLVTTRDRLTRAFPEVWHELAARREM